MTYNQVFSGNIIEKTLLYENVRVVQPILCDLKQNPINFFTMPASLLQISILTFTPLSTTTCDPKYASSNLLKTFVALPARRAACTKIKNARK